MRVLRGQEFEVCNIMNPERQRRRRKERSMCVEGEEA